MESSLKEGINIGVFNPEGYDCLTSEPLNGVKIYGYYVMCDDKVRMLRQLNREEHPNVEEICRRFFADEEDFIPSDLADMPLLATVRNETEEDLLSIVSVIERDIQDGGPHVIKYQS
jgi:hypothetical protein